MPNEAYLCEKFIFMKISTSLLSLLFTYLLLNNSFAQVNITTLNSPQTITFNSFNGSGFSPTPAAGQLDSDTWSILGFDSGNLLFGGTMTTAATDYTRGVSTGGITTGGVYAFVIAPNDTMLGFQPTGNDFTPGDLIMRIQNVSGATIQDLTVSYDFVYLNNGDRNNSFNLSYSTDTALSSFTNTAVGDTTPTILSATATWTSVAKSITLTGVNIPNNGVFYIRWTSFDVGGSGSRDEFGINNITVSGTGTASTADITAAFTGTNVCHGAATPFTDMSQSVNSTVTAWNWNFGDGNISTVQNPTHTYALPGSYSVQLIATNANNETDTSTSMITVYPNPEAGFTVSDVNGCAPFCVTFTDTSSISSGSISSYAWDFRNGVTSTTANPTICYPVAGNYDIKLIITSADGCTDTLEKSDLVTVYAPGTAAFSYSSNGPAVTFTNASTGGSGSISYSWNFGDNTSSTDENPVHTYLFDGTYTACLMITDTAGCSDTTCQQITVIGTALDDLGVNKVRIYPNPSVDGMIYLATSASDASFKSITVTNIIGAKISEIQVSAAAALYTLDLSNQPAGTYFVRVLSGNDTYIEKVHIK